MRRGRAAAVMACLPVLLLGLAVGSGCGGGGGTGKLSSRAKNELGDRTADVRSAVTAGDRPAAEAALARLRTSVNRLRNEDEVGRERAEGLLALAARVESALTLMPAPRPQPTTTTSTVAPTPREGGEEKKGEEDKGRNGDKGKGDD